MGFFSGKVSDPFQFDNSSSTLDNFYDNLTTLFITFAGIEDFATFYFESTNSKSKYCPHPAHQRKNKQTRKDFKIPLPAKNLKFREV